MSANKNTDRVCLAVLAVMILVTILFMNGEALGIRAVADEDAGYYKGNQYFTSNDLNGSWNTSGAVKITLTGDSARIKGGGAYFNDGCLTIKNGGYYVVSGELTDGSIVVDAYESSKVWIMLEGASVRREDTAAVIVRKADKVFLTMAEGTENYLESGETYSDEAQEEKINAVIWSKEDLTINGSGTLHVSAGYRHGIKCNDSLVVSGGKITVNSPGDGLHANDSIRITNADITIETGDDAIRCDREIYIGGGNIMIPECYEGLEAFLVQIDAGEITIHAVDDGINAGGQLQSDEWPLVRIGGGSVTIINENGRDADGIDSNGDILIEGGQVLVSLSGMENNPLDYGSENGRKLYLNGGTVVAAGDHSMMEEVSSDSLQGNIMLYLDEEQAAGSVLKVTGSEGDTVLEQEIPGSFLGVIVSCARIETGKVYRVSIGENFAEEITMDQTSASFGKTGKGVGRLSMSGFAPAAPAEPVIPPMEEGGTPPPDAAAPDQEMAQQAPWEQLPRAGELPSAGLTAPEENTWTARPVSEYGPVTRMLLAASCIVLLAGLVIVAIIRKAVRK